jgi:drug/metabolite transporter (DMT)-like permease
MASYDTNDKPTEGFSPALLLLLIVVYLILNLSLNLYNKLVFSSYHFNFPCIIMFFHQGLLYFTLRTFTLFGFVPKPTFQTKAELAGPVMIVGFFFALNIICNNASLIFISLSLNQCLKAATPIIMIAVSYIVERKSTPLNSIGAACVVVFGSVLVVLKNPGFDLTGVFLCLLSALTGAFQFSAASLTMKGKSNLVFHVTMYTALVVTFLCLPAVIVLELDDFHEYAQEHSMAKCLGLLVLGGSMAIMYLLVTNALIVNGGSVYLTVLGNLKLALIVLVSCYVFQDQLATINVIGILVTILGFMLYTYVKQLNATKNQSKHASKEQLQKDIEKLSKEEDEFATQEEQQSLLLNGASAAKSRGIKKRSGNTSTGPSSSGRSTALFVEFGMGLFIFCAGLSLICTPRHTLQKNANATGVAHAAASAALADHSPHYEVPITTTTAVATLAPAVPTSTVENHHPYHTTTAASNN